MSSKHPNKESADGVRVSGKKPYRQPAIVDRELIEAVAATCGGSGKVAGGLNSLGQPCSPINS